MSAFTRRANFLLSILVCTAVLAAAQSDTLTLATALTRAGSSNLSIAMAENAIRRNESHVRETKSQRFPALFARGHYLHSPTPGYNETVTNGGEYGAQVSAGILLYDGGVRESSIDQAANDVSRSLVALHKARIDVAFAVKSGYYDVVRLQDEITVREQGVDRLREYVRLLDQLMHGGSATDSDLMKAAIDLQNAEIALATSREGLATARIQLADLLHMSLDSTFAATPAGCDDPIDAIRMTSSDNLDIQLARHDQTASTLDVSLAQAERYPVISLVADAGLLGITPDDYKHDFGYSILLSLEFPIFTWGGISERIAQKEVTKSIADLQWELTRRGVDARWKITLADLALAQENIAAYTTNTRQAEKNFSAARSRFIGGSGSNLEVLEAARLLMESQVNTAAAREQIRIARATLVQLSGQP